MLKYYELKKMQKKWLNFVKLKIIMLKYPELKKKVIQDNYQPLGLSLCKFSRQQIDDIFLETTSKYDLLKFLPRMQHSSR